MALTKVAPSVIAVANNVVSNTFGGAGKGITLTFDASGVITSAANTTILSNGQISFVSSGIGVIPDNTVGITPYKILGQIKTTANAHTNVYVVPASTQTLVSTITICNQSANNVLVDLAARNGSDALANKHFIVYQYPLGAADTLILEPRLSMNATSVLSANVTGANAASNVSVNAFGVEIV